MSLSETQHILFFIVNFLMETKMLLVDGGTQVQHVFLFCSGTFSSIIIEIGEH